MYGITKSQLKNAYMARNTKESETTMGGRVKTAVWEDAELASPH